MQAIIMAAGNGIRMRPLTSNLPKPLLKLNHKTIIDHTISQMPDAIDEIVVVVGYLKEQIKEYLAEQYPGEKIVFIEEDKLLGTGYAVFACKEGIRNNFLVVNGDDLYLKSDLEKLLDFDLAFLAKDVSSEPYYDYEGRSVGTIKLDKEKHLVDIIEDSFDRDEPHVNIGAYILNQDFFKYELVEIGNGEYGLPQTLAKMAREGQKVKIVEADFWYPIGYPEDLKKARHIWSERFGKVLA